MLKLVSLLFFFSFCAQASLPIHKNFSIADDEKVSMNTVLTVLELPPANRESALRTQPKEAYKYLKEIAFESKYNIRIRWAALMAATKMGKANMVPLLRKAAFDRDWFMRNAALIGLKEVSSKDAIEIAQKLLTDKSMVVSA